MNAFLVYLTATYVKYRRKCQILPWKCHLWLERSLYIFIMF